MQKPKRGFLQMKRRPARSQPACGYTPARQQKLPASDWKSEKRVVTSQTETTLEDLLCMTEHRIRKHLLQHGHLAYRNACPACGSPLPKPVKQTHMQKCTKKSCRKPVHLHTDHPVFELRGASKSLKTQAAILFCAAWGVQQSLVPALIKDAKRTSVETVYGYWREAVKTWVVDLQHHGKFGTGSSSSSRGPRDEFEIDEACFRKQLASDEDVPGQLLRSHLASLNL